MIIPTVLQPIIQEALSQTAKHPDHDLMLGHRHAIYKALGPLNTTIGHKRRTVLSIFTVEHVLPIWNRVRPDDAMPYHVLEKAEQTLIGTFNIATLQQDIDNFWTYMDDLAVKLGGQPPSGIGYAAIEALNTAVNDEEFDPSTINYNLTDEDVDAYEHDAAFFAAADYANGPVWVDLSNRDKRWEFWQWWLTEAVPSAWWAVWQPEQGVLKHLQPMRKMAA